MAEVGTQESGDALEIREPLIMISIGRTYRGAGTDVYDAVRKSWKIDVNKAKHYNLVLARYRDRIVGAYRPDRWEPAREGRWQFVGQPARLSIWDFYVKKRVPDQYRKQGAANPVRFCEPEE